MEEGKNMTAGRGLLNDPGKEQRRRVSKKIGRLGQIRRSVGENALLTMGGGTGPQGGNYGRRKKAPQESVVSVTRGKSKNYFIEACE